MGRFALKNNLGRKDQHLKLLKSPHAKFNINSVLLGNASVSTASPFKRKKIGQILKINAHQPKFKKLLMSLKENEVEDSEEGLSPINEEEKYFSPIKFQKGNFATPTKLQKEKFCTPIKFQKDNFATPIKFPKKNICTPIKFQKKNICTPIKFPKEKCVNRAPVEAIYSPIRFPSGDPVESCDNLALQEVSRDFRDALKADVTVKRDQVLKIRKGRNGETVLWLPAEGRSLAVSEDDYVPFNHIVRTVHLHDALEVYYSNCMATKQLVNFSRLNSSCLSKNHPCKKLRVLWFGAEFSKERIGDHNWYGNVRFTLPTNAMSYWKHCYLVEMVTTPTHTASRVLLSNNDYSEELNEYDWFRKGGPFYMKGESCYTLKDCSRYDGVGVNKHGHILEFLIEANQHDERVILEKSKLSFVNHEAARNMNIAHVCHRHQRSYGVCPTPFTAHESARQFFTTFGKIDPFKRHQPDNLSESAKQLCKSLMQESYNWDARSMIVCQYDTSWHFDYDHDNLSGLNVNSYQDYFSINRNFCVKDYYYYDEQFCDTSFANVYPLLWN